MAPEQGDTKKMVGLPVSVASPVDLGRLIRELEAIDNSLTQLSVRGGGGEVKMPQTSQLLDQTVELNKLNLLQESDRKLLKQFLQGIRQRSPRLHMSFGADPSPKFIETLTQWLRTNVHPLVLLTIGLQPNIGAGCVVRTTNKYFDFSLGKHLGENRELLMSKLGAVSSSTPEVAEAPAEATA